MAETDEGLIEELRACISGRKNPTNCMNKIFEEHGIEKEKIPAVLAQVIKRIDEHPVEPKETKHE